MEAPQSQLTERLRELARNLWWTWQPEVIDLFRSLNPALWSSTRHNPIEFLQQIDPEELHAKADAMALDSRVDYAFRRLKDYLANRVFPVDIIRGKHKCFLKHLFMIILS